MYKNSVVAGALLGCVVFASPLCGKDFFRDFFKAREPDVLTVTDLTEEGRKWPVATPENPVYYEAISYGAKNFPGMPGDPAPSGRAMVDLIVKTLAKQGYLPAKKTGVATLYLSFGWGYSRANLGALGFLGGDKVGVMWELESGPMLSPNVLRRHTRSATAEKIVEAANSDLYIASIQAFDLKAIDAGVRKLLWHTRIACPASGLSMAETLPEMIVAAGPFLGKETKQPVWRDAEPLRKGQVEIGDSEVIDYLKRDSAGAIENGTQN